MRRRRDLLFAGGADKHAGELPGVDESLALAGESAGHLLGGAWTYVAGSIGMAVLAGRVELQKVDGVPVFDCHYGTSTGKYAIKIDRLLTSSNLSWMGAQNAS